MPAADVVAELLEHNTNDDNILSKIIQPKAFEADYRAGRLGAFILLACMANNVMYSRHEAVRRAGFVTATRQLVDQAKALAPAALEEPSVRNCQALLMLAIAYMHLGKLDVASHYSSITLRTLQQLGVCTMDNSDCGDADGWLRASWLEREQLRRLVWGGFTVDTFLSLMLHTAPYVLVDLSGVNRPCAPNMWYVGNDNLESLSFPRNAAPCYMQPQPSDSEYMAALKALKVNGMRWSLNGNTVQLNFAVLGNAILRGISDPQAVPAQVDRLVISASKSVTDWLAPLPHMPAQPSRAELTLTLMVSSASLCLWSIITPYLFSRTRPHAETPPELREMGSEHGLDRLLADYISAAHSHYTHAQLMVGACEDGSMPPMFAAYSMMVCGGMFAACAHAAPSERLRQRFGRMVHFFAKQSRTCAVRSLLFQRALDEIRAVADMARHLPRRLDTRQLLQIRDTLLPGAIEAAVNKRFAQFVEPIRPILRAAACPEHGAEPARPRCGVIPLTSNLCAIFGQALGRSGFRLGRAASEAPSDDSASKSPPPPPSESSTQSPTEKCAKGGPSALPAKDKLPNYKLSFTAISSLMIGLTVATKDESFFDFLPPDPEPSQASSPKSGSSLGNILN
ncbi:hypothetical protein IWW55_004215 [Coemansia sp. RSA 2706]|nr:hypothetical protein IWW55_004215 [Coemansia sp. RSA 2706]